MRWRQAENYSEPLLKPHVKVSLETFIPIAPSLLDCLTSIRDVSEFSSLLRNTLLISNNDGMMQLWI